jgi:hypothetical protein
MPYTIYAGAKPIKNMGPRQYAMALFALKYPGWHTVANSNRGRGVATSLEMRGCIKIARHSPNNWSYMWSQSK